MKNNIKGEILFLYTVGVVLFIGIQLVISSNVEKLSNRTKADNIKVENKCDKNGDIEK